MTWKIGHFRGGYHGGYLVDFGFFFAQWRLSSPVKQMVLLIIHSRGREVIFGMLKWLLSVIKINNVGFVRLCLHFNVIFDLETLVSPGVSSIKILRRQQITQRPNYDKYNRSFVFQTLQKVVSPLSVGECAGGHRSENRRKSRDIMLQPREFSSSMRHYTIIVYNKLQ